MLVYQDTYKNIEAKGYSGSCSQDLKLSRPAKKEKLTGVNIKFLRNLGLRVRK